MVGIIPNVTELMGVGVGFARLPKEVLIMRRYRGSSKVKAGFYWSPQRWEIYPMPGHGGILPGAGDTHYYRVPMLLMLFGAPLLGLAYVIFLPFIGFAMVFSFLGQKLYRLGQRVAYSLMDVAVINWRFGEAYLVGKKKRGKEKSPADSKGEGGEDIESYEADYLAELEKEIGARREKEKD
jgi:hypothetical protein